MPDFGWSLPPGCGTLPGEEEPSSRGVLYLTSKTARAGELIRCADQLESISFELATDWFRNVADRMRDDDLDSMLAALGEWDVLPDADILVCFTEMESASAGKGGRHVLLGAAYALGKRCIIVGPREHVFHFLPDVEAYPTWEEAFAVLSKYREQTEPEYSGEEYDPFPDDVEAS